MSLDILEYDVEESPLRRMMNRLRDKRGFNLTRILVLAVLCSRGDTSVKAGLFFDLLDIELTQKISRQSFIYIIECLLSCALELLPVLAMGDGHEQIQTDRINSYIFTLKKITTSA